MVAVFILQHPRQAWTEHFVPAGTGAGAARGSTGGGRRTGSTTRTDIGSGRGGRETATEKGDLGEIFFAIATGSTLKIFMLRIVLLNGFGAMAKNHWRGSQFQQSFSGKLGHHRMPGWKRSLGGRIEEGNQGGRRGVIATGSGDRFPPFGRLISPSFVFPYFAVFLYHFAPKW